GRSRAADGASPGVAVSAGAGAGSARAGGEFRTHFSRAGELLPADQGTESTLSGFTVTRRRKQVCRQKSEQRCRQRKLKRNGNHGWRDECLDQARQYQDWHSPENQLNGFQPGSRKGLSPG